MARKMGRIQAYEYWSEQYHSARLLVNELIKIQHGLDARIWNGKRHVDRRAKANRMMPLARRRQARMLAMAEKFEKPVARGRKAA
jgi:hypothetical protein